MQQNLIIVDLSSALTSDALTDVLSDSETLYNLQDLLPPVGGNPQETLRSTLASPQFQQVGVYICFTLKI